MPAMLIRFYYLMCCVGVMLLVACDSNSSGGGSTTRPPQPTPVTLEQETVDLPSAAQPSHTPGSPGVVVSNPALLKQFGTAAVDLNRARYTRFFLSDQAGVQPDVILVLVPGFLGGASSFARLAENLVRRAQADNSLVLEVWAVDRRSNPLEDTVGLDLAEELEEPAVGLDFLFGKELGLQLSEALARGPNRRVVFYNNSSDTAFMAEWTPLVHSRDIDAIVKKAGDTAANRNVFLGGHSAGTGYAAYYAATDFNLAGGDPDPGYRKLRGLVLLEGGGASNVESPPEAVTLDLIEARFDGGLFGAVRDQAPRCSDGVTPCTVATQAQACAALNNQQCVESTPAYSDAVGLLTAQVYGAAELAALDAALNGDGVLSILQQEQNGQAGNAAIDKVPQLAGLKVLLGSGAIFLHEPAGTVSRRRWCGGRYFQKFCHLPGVSWAGGRGHQDLAER